MVMVMNETTKWYDASGFSRRLQYHLNSSHESTYRMVSVSSLSQWVWSPTTFSEWTLLKSCPWRKNGAGFSHADEYDRHYAGMPAASTYHDNSAFRSVKLRKESGAAAMRHQSGTPLQRWTDDIRCCAQHILLLNGARSLPIWERGVPENCYASPANIWHGSSTHWMQVIPRWWRCNPARP